MLKSNLTNGFTIQGFNLCFIFAAALMELLQVKYTYMIFSLIFPIVI